MLFLFMKQYVLAPKSSWFDQKVGIRTTLLHRNSKIMLPARIELATFRLWDWRSTNWAKGASTPLVASDSTTNTPIIRDINRRTSYQNVLRTILVHWVLLFTHVEVAMHSWLKKMSSLPTLNGPFEHYTSPSCKAYCSWRLIDYEPSIPRFTSFGSSYWRINVIPIHSLRAWSSRLFVVRWSTRITHLSLRARYCWRTFSESNRTIKTQLADCRDFLTTHAFIIRPVAVSQQTMAKK